MTPPPLSNFRALTFDCYGTLIDWETGILSVLRPWADRAAPGRPGDDALLEAFAAAESHHETERPWRPYPEILRLAMGTLADSLGAFCSESDREALARSVGDWPAFPDTPDALRALQSRFRLLVVSNVDHASFARTLPRLGVRLDGLVTADDVRAYKPDLAHFKAAAAILDSVGVRPDQTLHVAQSLHHDHEPALRLGLATAWIDRRAGRSGGGATPPPRVPVAPTFRAASLQAFADMVEADFEACGM